MSVLAQRPKDNASLSGMLSLLTNPDEYKSRVEHILELEAKADAKVALAGQAGEILAIREEIAKELVKVKQQSSDNERKIAKDLADAQAQIANMWADCHARCQKEIAKSLQEQELIVNDAKAELAKLGERTKSLLKQQADSTKALEEKQAQIKAYQDQVLAEEAQIKKLKAAAEKTLAEVEKMREAAKKADVAMQERRNTILHRLDQMTLEMRNL